MNNVSSKCLRHALGHLSFGTIFAAAALLFSASSAWAQVSTFTDPISFENALSGPAYLEPFNEYSGETIANGQSFSFGPYNYIISDPSGLISYSTGAGDEGSVFASAEVAGESLTITFNSQNITAVGGTFFLSDYNFSPLAGASVTATLSSGQTISEASTATYTTEPFFGFTSDTPIQSLTLTAPSAIGNTAAYLSLDNLIVGPATVVTAPEPATWALLIGGCVMLVGLARVRPEALA